MLNSSRGVPVSTSQVVSSAIIGVGSAERASKVRWSVAEDIMTAWLITIPASAVMGDVMAIARNLGARIGIRTPAMGCPQAAVERLAVKPMEELVSSYYLRVFARDQPGVLAQIAGILGRHRISIESMIQPLRHAADAVPIVLMTHEAVERDVRAALAEIDQLEVIRDQSLLVRIEEGLE